MINQAIEKAIRSSSHKNHLFEIMEYAVFPAGKLFRPRLVEAIALDLDKKMSTNHLHLAAAIEIHHAYTLVHDDLPAMDNDLIRRGKPSTHAKFGEWKAILAGDALLIASFNEVSKIQHPRFQEIFKLMTWATGAKGLVEGQFRDLEANGEANILDVVRIHELKTGRLIQLSTLGAYLLANETSYRGKIDFLRLGKNIGITFQLLDDLCELTSKEVSPHEMKINPFIHSGSEALNYLKTKHASIGQITTKYQLHHVDTMLKDYFLTNKKILQTGLSTLKVNMSGSVRQFEEWITNFA
jgi:geranylgeranyl pyrophosphate synthase